jgi:hypothetical protein
MSGGTSTRQVRQTRPELEGLEDRRLLTHPFIDKYGMVHNLIIPPQDLSRWQRAHTAYVPPSDRRYAYTTNEGTHVVLSLYGNGNILGTKFNPATDAVDIRFANTNENSGLIGKVYGGDGRANLSSLINAGLPANSVSGLGSSLIRVVNLKNFDLVQGGRVNLTGGVQTFMLNSTASNTQISLREIPPGLLQNQQSTTTENGVTYGYAINLFGARSLTTTSGTFVAGANLLPTAVPTNPNQPATPPGVVVSIAHVDGMAQSTGIGAPTLYGYDPATDSLVRFAIQYNATSKTFSGIPTVVANNVLHKTGVEAGVSLGRYHGQLVVLVSDGTTLYGFNALDGTPVGTPAALAPLIPAMPNPTRLGNVDSFTVIGDPNAPGTNGLGLLQIIDVTASLDKFAKNFSGTVKTVGVPFASARAFGLSGGMTGIPGSSTLYTAGGGYLDPYQPNAFELGVLSLSPTDTTGSLATATFSESSRNALTSLGNTILSNAHGGTASSKNDALSSINLSLALVTGSNGTTNTVTLFNPTTFASQGTIALNYGNPLSGMTSVFYPQLQGSALVDVQGNVQSFRANDAQGLVLNDTGNLNLAKINSAVDTTILGAPFGHAQIPRRQNVVILSTPRAPGTRNGVTVVPQGILPVGPLQLP